MKLSIFDASTLLDFRAMSMMSSYMPVIQKPYVIKGIPRLRVWRYPSFAPFKTYILYGPHLGQFEPYTVEEIIWDRNKELERLESIELIREQINPEFLVRQKTVEKSFADSLMSEIPTKFERPFTQDQLIMAGGETFGIENYDSDRRVSIEWAICPEEWLDLAKFFDTTFDAFVKVFEDSDLKSERAV